MPEKAEQNIRNAITGGAKSDNPIIRNMAKAFLKEKVKWEIFAINAGANAEWDNKSSTIKANRVFATKNYQKVIQAVLAHELAHMQYREQDKNDAYDDELRSHEIEYRLRYPEDDDKTLMQKIEEQLSMYGFWNGKIAANFYAYRHRSPDERARNRIERGDVILDLNWKKSRLYRKMKDKEKVEDVVAFIKQDEKWYLKNQNGETRLENKK